MKVCEDGAVDGMSAALFLLGPWERGVQHISAAILIILPAVLALMIAINIIKRKN